MTLPLPETENLDDGRAIVIEDVPPGTGIGDLIRAFSPFGAIWFASVGPPAVVSFESEASAAHALLVASMKSVSLLGAFREKKLQVSASSQPTAPRKHPSPSSAPAAPLLRASPETEIGPNEASPAEATMKSVSHLGAFREKNLLVPGPAATQPATCCNHPSSGTSMSSPRENTVGSITGRLNPAPSEEPRLSLFRSVASSITAITEDEYYNHKIIGVWLYLFFLFLVIPEMRIIFFEYFRSIWPICDQLL